MVAEAVAAHGTWPSPLDAAAIAEGSGNRSFIGVQDGSVYWMESRPAEGGRQVLIRWRGGEIVDVTPPPYNVRSRVHEYGGRSYVVRTSDVVFSNFSDQRLYRVDGETIDPLTAEPGTPAGIRYAAGVCLDDDSMIMVREAHHADHEPTNDLAHVSADGADITTVATGADFYGSPVTDGTRLAWTEWDHPNMPWDSTRLIVSGLDGSDPVTVVDGDESVMHPVWGPAGHLYFVSDRSGFWNLWRWDGDTIEQVVSLPHDIGSPAWVLGDSSYGFLGDGRIVFSYWRNGVGQLAMAGPGGVSEVDDEFTSHRDLVTDGDRAYFVGYRSTGPEQVISLDTADGTHGVLQGDESNLAPDFIPSPEIITFPTTEGEAHGVFYPPASGSHVAPDGELPPVVVIVHGGPTSHTFPRYQASVAYWTSRGLAVVDVNHRGSTGYGRQFRRLHRDTWGVVDVEDCEAAVRYLSDTGRVDGGRAVIRGGSAGGYTTLAALAFTDAFAAGASYFGVADLDMLNAHTHKFESRYVDSLAGTDPEVLAARSPLRSANAIAAPLILFQGLEDKVVPPEQTEAIAAALAENGTPHVVIMYEGEDHGFRQADTIIHSLESELAFYGHVLGFTPAGDLPAVELS